MHFLILLALPLLARTAFYEHIKGSYDGQKTLGFRHHVGHQSSNAPQPISQCSWNWDYALKDERGLIIPVWECPHCDPVTGKVFDPVNLRWCSAREVYTAIELAILNRDCDWVSGDLFISVAGAVSVDSIVRVTGNVHIDNIVTSFVAPHLVVIGALEVHGAALTSLSLPSLETICDGSLIIAPSTTLPLLSAPRIGPRSSFALVLDGLTRDIAVDLGSVGGGPSHIVGRLVVNGVGATISIYGLTNVKRVTLPSTAAVITLNRVAGQRTCPVHGAEVIVAPPPSSPPGSPSPPLSAFRLTGTAFTECSPRRTAAAAAVWTSITVQSNTALTEAALPPTTVSGDAVFANNPTLRVYQPHIAAIGGTLEVSATTAAAAPRAPYDEIVFPALVSIGGGLVVTSKGPVRLIDIGSGSGGGPTSLHGSLHISCVPCWRLVGMSRLATVESAKVTDVVHVEGIANVGRSQFADTVLHGQFSRVAYVKNNWNLIYFNKGTFDYWTALTVTDNPYLESLRRPTNWVSSGVGSVTITGNSLLPASCATTAVWQVPVTAMNNHPDPALPCPGT